MGGSQPANIVSEIEVINRLEEIEDRIREIGLSKDEFREILVREKIIDSESSLDSIDVLKKVDDFVNNRKEDLRGIVEARKKIEELYRMSSKEDVDNFLESNGFKEIPLDADARNQMLELIENYRPETSMKMEIALLRNIAKAVSGITDECVVHFDEDGFEIRAVDPGFVVMVIVKVSSERLSYYSSDKRAVGVEWSKVLDYTKMLKEEVSVEITNQFVIKTDDRTIKVGLINPSTIKVPKKPELNFDATIRVTDLHRIVSIHQMIGNMMRIIADSKDSKAVLRTENDADVIEDYAEVVESKDKGKAESLYSMEYLKAIANGLRSFTNEVTIKFSSDHPACFEYSGDGISVQYLLAPRIENS